MTGSASVAIVGGGIIGMSIAYNLATRGIESVVLERSKPGGGSTSASLGGFRHQFSNELSVRLSQRSVKILESFEELSGCDPLMRRDGYVFTASRPSSFEQLKKNRDLQRSLGVSVELLSCQELQERYPFYDFNGVLGGTLCSEDGHASTMAVLQGYLSAGKRLGVEVREDTNVVAIERRPAGGFSLRTSRGQLGCDSVVIAAGAFSRLVGRLASVDIPIDPYPRRALITRNFLGGIPPQIPLIIDVDSTFAFGREGRGLMMANNEQTKQSFELSFPPDYDERVMQEATKRVPAARECSLSHAIVGLYEMTPDANPIVCEFPGAEGLYCCSGFEGHGFMHAPAIGETMAELVSLGRTSLDISSYHISRFREGQRSPESLII
jgi:sarcosine oxidase subunit beta